MLCEYNAPSYRVRDPGPAYSVPTMRTHQTFSSFPADGFSGAKIILNAEISPGLREVVEWVAGYNVYRCSSTPTTEIQVKTEV